MAAGVPPPPLNSPSGSYYWLEWYTSLTNFLNGTNIPWSSLNFSGSDLTDIQIRNHNDLQNIQGGTGNNQSNGEFWHMAGCGYVSITGVPTGFPAGWTAAHTSTGVFTVTTTLTEAIPNVSALATSNTLGVSVQWIDMSTSGTFVVHLVNSSGVATDGTFSLIVNS
jgi:hypothetical protein